MHQSASQQDSLLARSLIKLQASPLSQRRSIWPWCVAATIFLGLVYVIAPSPFKSTSLLLTAVGGMWALAFYLHARHAADAKFVKELLGEFNDRYDKLGSELQFALAHRGEFEKETELRFIRYFNLCAEEWLFWKAGYIYDPVWNAWRNGMKQYSADPRVAALWEKEKATDSYYGFDFRNVTNDV
jgi:hypothetical protein